MPMPCASSFRGGEHSGPTLPWLASTADAFSAHPLPEVPMIDVEDMPVQPTMDIRIQAWPIDLRAADTVKIRRTKPVAYDISLM